MACPRPGVGYGLVLRNDEESVGNNFLGMQHNEHAARVVRYHLYPPLDLVCRCVFPDNWSQEFTKIVLDNLCSSIRHHVLVSLNIIDNQRDGWVALEVQIFGAVRRGGEKEGRSIPCIPYG